MFNVIKLYWYVPAGIFVGCLLGHVIWGLA
jgi:hypothetical protein